MKGLLLLWTHGMQILCGFLVRSLGLQGYDFLDAEPQPKFQGFKNFVYASCGATQLSFQRLEGRTGSTTNPGRVRSCLKTEKKTDFQAYLLC